MILIGFEGYVDRKTLDRVVPSKDFDPSYQYVFTINKFFVRVSDSAAVSAEVSTGFREAYHGVQVSAPFRDGFAFGVVHLVVATEIHGLDHTHDE